MWAVLVLGIATHLVFKKREPRASAYTAGFLLIGPYILHKWCYASSSALKIYAVFYSAMMLSIFSYRISAFHPLSKFPGPMLHKLSKLWGVWVSSTGHQHHVFKALHDKYGPVVRIGPNEISICDAKAVTDVLGANGLPKGPFYDARQDPSAPRNLIVLRGIDHSNRRRLWNRGMSTESLADYAHIISKRAGQLVDQLDRIDGPVDLAAWLSYLSFDFMGDMAFGGGFEMMRNNGDKDGLWSVLENFLFTASLVSHIPWASLLLQCIPWVAKPLQRLRNFGVACATKRLRSGANQKDLWYHLTDEAGLEKNKPPIPDVIADGALAIIAGADTAATAMASLFYFLLSNPEYMRRAQEEVDAVYPPDSNALDPQQHSQLTFLNACINEALRLNPPVPTNGARVVPKGSRGVVIAGWFIQEGTQVYIPPYCIHRDPRYFSPSPNSFLPDRWLRNSKLDESNAFIPFSFGPANCVGRQLARQEILMISSILLQKYTISIAVQEDFTENAWEYALHDHFVVTRGKLRVTLIKRK